MWEGSCARRGPLPGAPGSRRRGTGWWRSLFSGIWLVYLIQPVSDLFHHHYGVLFIALGLVIMAVFCAFYLCVIAAWHPNVNWPWWVLGPLFALGAVASLLYGGGQGWGNVWIYVSAAAGLAVTDRRAAARTVLASGACFVLFSWLGHDGVADFLITLLPVVLLGFAMLGFRMQIELTHELSKARESVARLAASEERLRLARDMHDLTGQSLSMVTLKSEVAARLLGRLPASPERDQVRDQIEQVAEVSRQTLHDIREAISGYRRPTLAVEVITARSALDSAGISVHDDSELMLVSGTFDADAEAALAWCLREAVTNVIRHSGARNCYISLARRAGSLSLRVRDDGRGLGSASQELSPSRGTGLRGMSERLSAVGGDLELRPSAVGFCLVATVLTTSSADAAREDASVTV